MTATNGHAKLSLDALHTDNVVVLGGLVIFRFRPNSFQNRKEVDRLEAVLRQIVTDPDELAHVGNYAFLIAMTEAIEFGEVQGSLALFRDWWTDYRINGDTLDAFHGYLAQELRVLNLWADAHNQRTDAMLPPERRPRFMATEAEREALDDPDSPLAEAVGNGSKRSSDGPKS